MSVFFLAWSQQQSCENLMNRKHSNDKTKCIGLSKKFFLYIVYYIFHCKWSFKAIKTDSLSSISMQQLLTVLFSFSVHQQCLSCMNVLIQWSPVSVAVCCTMSLKLVCESHSHSSPAVLFLSDFLKKLLKEHEYIALL